MKKLFKWSLIVTTLVLLFGLFSFLASAETSGYYTYSVSNGEATITDVDDAISGDVVIPSTLGGYPVTSIGDSAFRSCDGLTSITIPDSVTSIGDDAFYGCDVIRNVYITDVAAWCNIDFRSLISNPLRYAENLYINGVLTTNVVIPDSVTSIGDYAFYGCSSLKSITIPDSVTSIGDCAFRSCDRLTSITVDNENKYYSSDERGVLFNKDKTKLIQYPAGKKAQEYIIPDSVTSIGDHAFSECYSLTSITIPDSVTSIGNDAFEYCDSLTSIAIPDSVTSIGDCAFRSCDRLTSITVDNENKYYSSDGRGVLFNKDKTKLIQYPASKEAQGYIIPDSVTSIGDDAFYYCHSLKSITIPDSVTNIGVGAFECCYNLTSITIPDSVTSIGNYAFYGCSSLTSITIPDSVTSIGDYAFFNCSSLINLTIGNGVTSIGDSAFRSCDRLTSITISDSVTSIGNCAFCSCDRLTSITVDNENKYYSSDERGVLFNKDKIKLIQYPAGNKAQEYIIPDSVTSIGDSAFYYCDSLTNVTIGNGVTSIGEDAFFGCSSLANVYITDVAAWCNIDFRSSFSNPLRYAENLYINGVLTTNVVIPDSVTSIGNYAFYDCSSLTSITIPDGVTSIGDSAFNGCDGLTNVTIGNGVKSIGDYSFYYCDSLTIITIPDGVTNIGVGAFRYCQSLINVTIGNGVKSIGDYAFYGCSGLTSITIPDSVTSIGVSAFRYCDSLTSITIPDSVTNIGNEAFRSCGSLTSITVDNENKYYSSDERGVLFNKDKTKLIQYPIGNKAQEYIIPDSVTSIGDDAFYGCHSLTSITIPDSVTSIGNYAFYDCYSLKSITIPDSVTSIGDSAFRSCDGLTSITIPDSVTSIGDSAFRSCDGLTSITIPDSVTSIGEDAFYYCDSLTNVTIGNGVTSIGEDAFYDCSSLANVYITDVAAWCNIDFRSSFSNPLWYAENLHINGVLTTNVAIPDSVTSIGDYAFYGCSSLTSITIPDGVTNIGVCAFYNCDGLTSITIPDSVTNIGGSAFNGCSSLTSITIPDSVTSIGGSAFNGCSSLTSITIPDSVTSIGGSAFSGCSSLTSITIPDSVTSIGGSAFYDCSSLTIITIPDGVTSIGEDAFSGCSSLASITIPDSVTSIGDFAFNGCRSLTIITIPDGVTNIGFGAFNGCYGLKIVYYLDTVAQKKNINIGSYNGNLTSATWYYESCIGTVEHTYDNNCDTMCNVCSYVRTAPHVYDNACDTTCNICGATRKVGAHKYSNSCDTTCDYCNAKRTIKHTYSNNCDTSCNVCKATRTITHTYKTTTTKATLTKNGSVVKKCTVCGKVASNTAIKYVKTFKLSTTAYTYDGKVKTPTVTVKDSAGKILKEKVDYTVTYDSGRKNAGNYQVTIKMKGNYTGTKRLIYTIKKIDVDTCTVKLSQKTYTYNGKVQKPTVTVKNANGTTLKEDKHYTVTYQKGRKNAGTYKVTVKMKGNYNGTKTLNFKIKPISISKCEITLSKTNYTYDGKSKIPSVTVLNHKGTKLTDSSYTVTYESGRKNVGAYKVTIKMKGNYTGTKTLTFKIKPKKISSYKLTATSYTYNGKTKTPSVVVKNSNGTKLTKNTHYTVSYSSGRKNVGTYKVTIKGKGNYTGTKTLTFKINPAKTKVSKLTTGKKKITVAITKKSTQVTGYQIQYSTSKKFTNAKTKTISSYKTTKYTLKSLSAKKTYYVRVRTYKTVGKTKYYSGWSTYKYVKTK